MSTPTQFQSRESGAGLVMFLVIGAVLLVMTAGGVYVARKRGELAATTTPAPAAQNKTNDSSSSGKPTDRPAGADNQQGAQQDKPQNAAPQQNTPAAPSQPQQNNGQGNTAQPAPAAPSQAPSTGPSQIASTGPSAIPATGIAENMVVAGIGLAALTLAGISYVQARRRFFYSARRQ